MKHLYIYEYVEGVTENWHSGGGVLIITSGDPQAAWDASDRPDTNLGAVDRVVDVPDYTEDAIIVFPDAGCC